VVCVDWESCGVEVFLRGGGRDGDDIFKGGGRGGLIYINGRSE